MSLHGLVLPNGTIDVLRSEPFSGSAIFPDGTTTEHRYIGGELIAPTPPPKFADADSAKAAMIEWADAFTDNITGPVPKNEKHSWSDKKAAAIAFTGGTADELQLAMLDRERSHTGETREELVISITKNANAFTLIGGDMAGIRRDTIKLLDAVTDPYEYETILSAAHLKAVAALESLG